MSWLRGSAPTGRPNSGPGLIHALGILPPSRIAGGRRAGRSRDAVDFRKPHPSEWRRHPNQNMIWVDDRDWPAFRASTVRLLQVATTAGSRNPGTAASAQCFAAARTTSSAFALGRPCFVHLARRCPRILDAVTIVRPETVVRWH